MPNILTLSLPIAVKMPSWATRTFFLKLVLGLLALGFFSLLCLYLLQIGDLMAKSFALQNVEATMEGLSRDNGNLKVETVNQLSFQGLEERISQLNFVTVEQVKYIPIYSKQLVSNVK